MLNIELFQKDSNGHLEDRAGLNDRVSERGVGGCDQGEFVWESRLTCRRHSKGCSQ
jgi:hypothetical protein